MPMAHPMGWTRSPTPVPWRRGSSPLSDTVRCSGEWEHQRHADVSLRMPSPYRHARSRSAIAKRLFPQSAPLLQSTAGVLITRKECRRQERFCALEFLAEHRTIAL